MLYQFHANLSHSCIPFAVPTSSSCSHQPNNSARFQGNYASTEDGEILLAKHNCFSISPSFSPSGPPKTQIVKGRTQVVTMEQNPFEIPSCAMQWSEQDKKLPSALPSAALLCLPSQTAPSETDCGKTEAKVMVAPGAVWTGQSTEVGPVPSAAMAELPQVPFSISVIPQNNHILYNSADKFSISCCYHSKEWHCLGAHSG